MPQTFLAEGALNELPEILQRRSVTHPVIVAGSRSYPASGAAERIAGLLGKETKIFYAEAKLPDLTDFARFRHTFGNEEVGIVAIGGGRIIDIAKLISTDAATPEEVTERLVRGKKFRRVLPLIAVPTTAGSGSEVTPFAVVYIDGIKYSIDDASLKPDAALVDPALMLDRQAHEVAASGLDAMTHSIEALLSRRANSESDDYARSALALGWPALLEISSADSHRRIRTLAQAANLAGEAISITRTTAPHAFSYFFTRKFGTAHGHAVALSMGPYLALFGERIRQNSAELARWSDPYAFILRTIGAHSSLDVAARWALHLEALGLASSPQQLGIGPDDLRFIHPEINADRLANAPITLSSSDIDRLWGPL